MSLMCVCCRSTGRLRVANTFFSVLERLVAQVRPQIVFSHTLEKLGRTCDQIGRTLEPWARGLRKIDTNPITLTNQRLARGSLNQRLARGSLNQRLGQAFYESLPINMT